MLPSSRTLYFVYKGIILHTVYSCNTLFPLRDCIYRNPTVALYRYTHYSTCIYVYRLFSYVNEDKLSSASYSLFMALFDNYNNFRRQIEPEFNCKKETETKEFLDHLDSTEVMQIVRDVFVSSGTVRSRSYCAVNMQ